MNKRLNEIGKLQSQIWKYDRFGIFQHRAWKICVIVKPSACNLIQHLLQAEKLLCTSFHFFQNFKFYQAYGPRYAETCIIHEQTICKTMILNASLTRNLTISSWVKNFWILCTLCENWCNFVKLFSEWLGGWRSR